MSGTYSTDQDVKDLLQDRIDLKAGVDDYIQTTLVANPTSGSSPVLSVVDASIFDSTDTIVVYDKTNSWADIARISSIDTSLNTITLSDALVHTFKLNAHIKSGTEDYPVEITSSNNGLSIDIDNDGKNSITLTSGIYSGNAMASHLQTLIRALGANARYTDAVVEFDDSRLIIYSGTGSITSSVFIVSGGTANATLGFDSDNDIIEYGSDKKIIVYKSFIQDFRSVAMGRINGWIDPLTDDDLTDVLAASRSIGDPLRDAEANLAAAMVYMAKVQRKDDQVDNIEDTPWYKDYERLSLQIRKRKVVVDGLKYRMGIPKKVFEDNVRTDKTPGASVLDSYLGRGRLTDQYGRERHADWEDYV